MIFMLTIRLQRTGRKNNPSFRLVLTDSKNGPQSGKFLAVLGNYDVKGGKVSFLKDEIKDAMAKGAQVSATVHNMLVHEGMIEGKKKNVLSKKKPTGKRKENKK
jgi:small subunit ribosomal protein S16